MKQFRLLIAEKLLGLVLIVAPESREKDILTEYIYDYFSKVLVTLAGDPK